MEKLEKELEEKRIALDEKITLLRNDAEADSRRQEEQRIKDIERDKREKARLGEELDNQRATLQTVTSALSGNLSDFASFKKQQTMDEIKMDFHPFTTGGSDTKHRPLKAVTWIVKDLLSKKSLFQKTHGVSSPKFTISINNVQLTDAYLYLYPNGERLNTPPGYCSLYLECAPQRSADQVCLLCMVGRYV